MTVVVTHSTPADGSFSATGATAWNANHTLSGVGTMAEQNANAVAITGGSISGVSGVVISVGGTGTVNGLSLSGTVTSSGNLTFGGTLDLSSPPAIGGTAAAAGTFTTLVGRTNPRVTSAATATSLTPSIATTDVYAYTALASALSINAPTGTPLDGNKLIFRILDNGTARALTWDATYTVIGTTLPTTTVINKTTYVGCIYNANNTRWDVIAVTTQA